MGVNAIIKLPGNVRVRDVAEVAGTAAGLPKRWAESNGTRWVEVDGAKAQRCTTDFLCECAEIHLAGDLVDGEKHHHCLYHFEPSGHDGRLMLPKSTAFWIGVGRKLVDFFGGELHYTDYDEREPDYAVPHKSREENNPDDGEAWAVFQKRKAAVEPITAAELEAYDEFAAYKAG